MVGKGQTLLSLTKIRSYIKNRCILGIMKYVVFMGTTNFLFSSVTRRCKEFKSGVDVVEDAPHARRPKTATSQKYLKK